MDKRIPSKFQFWHFLELWWKFAKFVMSFSKQHVSFSSNSVSLFNDMRDNSSVLFSSNNIYFAQKEPIKVKSFRDFQVLGQNLSNSLCQIWKNKSIPLQIFYPSSVSWKIPPLFFLAQAIYTLLKRSLFKRKFFRLSSGEVKICQIPYINFETKSQFLSKFCIPP